MPESHTFFGTRSAYRIPIRFGGIDRDRATAIKTSQKATSEIQRFSACAAGGGLVASVDVTNGT
jgi:hypothetical protein